MAEFSINTAQLDRERTRIAAEERRTTSDLWKLRWVLDADLKSSDPMPPENRTVVALQASQTEEALCSLRQSIGNDNESEVVS